MGLVKAVTGALTHRPARGNSDPAIATIGMTGSVRALDAISKGSVRNGGTINSVLPLVSGKKLDQQQAHNMAQRLGQVIADARELKRLEPIVTEAAQAYVQAEQSRGKMAKAVGEAQQKVAVMNSDVQRKLFNSHADAAVQVTVNQSAYAGTGFSV